MEVSFKFKGAFHRISDSERYQLDKRTSNLTKQLHEIFDREDLEKLWNKGFYIEIDGESDSLSFKIVRRNEPSASTDEPSEK